MPPHRKEVKENESGGLFSKYLVHFGIVENVTMPKDREKMVEAGGVEPPSESDTHTALHAYPAVCFWCPDARGRASWSPSPLFLALTFPGQGVSASLNWSRPSGPLRQRTGRTALYCGLGSESELNVVVGFCVSLSVVDGVGQDAPACSVCFSTSVEPVSPPRRTYIYSTPFLHRFKIGRRHAYVFLILSAVFSIAARDSARCFARRSAMFGYLIERISHARYAAFFAPSIATVATGTPDGI